MAQISITINGRAYPVACADGEEQRIHDLARNIDDKVVDFAKQIGQAGEARLLVLAALVLADELDEVRAALAHAGGPPGESPEEVEVAQGVDELASRIDAIAARLETPHI